MKPEAVAKLPMMADDRLTPSSGEPARSIQIDAVVVVVALALSVAYVPQFAVPSYTPRLALLMVIAAAGTVALFRAVRRRSPVAMLAVALCAWALLSAMLSAVPWTSLLGVMGRESSALILVGSVLAWAAGRDLSRLWCDRYEQMLVWVMSFNAAIGIAQVVFDVDSGPFQLYGGRATGLLVSHVAFGACMAGSAVLVAVRAHRHGSLQSAWLVAVFAAAANLSGSRFAIAAGAVAMIGLFAVHERNRKGLGLLGAYIAGVALSMWANATLLDGVSATERATSADGAGRLTAWRYGLEAVGARPVVGWGPGRFRAAVQGRFSADFTSAYARDDLTQIWWDAHNIVVNTVVTIGIVGLGLAAAFGLIVAVRARGPLAWFAAVVASSWMLQPAGLATLPLVLFSLGVAGAGLFDAAHDRTSPGEEGTDPSTVGRIAVLVGLVVALAVVLADVQLEAALESGSAADVASAARRLPWDPVVADLASEAYSLYSTEETALDEAIAWEYEAVDREPDRPYYRNRLAALQLTAGDPNAARSTLTDSLEVQPWNLTSWRLLDVVAEQLGDEELSSRVNAAMCSLDPSTCE